MILKKGNTGYYLKLEKQDFKAAWKEFLAEIKKASIGAIYEPVELSDPDGWWFIPAKAEKGFKRLAKRYITDVLKMEEQLKAEGYKPIPRIGGRFNRKKLKF